MVKLTGPGLAHQATGSIAGELTFSTWKGKPYLKKHRRPKQPRTTAQRSMRAMLSFLSDQWSVISAADKATWEPLAERTNVSPFNAYQAYNLDRNRNLRRPSQMYPASEIGSSGAFGTYTATGGVRMLTLELVVNNPQDAWGAIYSHVSGSGVQPLWSDLIKLLPIPSIATYTWVWRPIPAGTYWIAFSRSTRYGQFWNATGWTSGVVTD